MTSAPPIGFEYRPAWFPVLLAIVVLVLACFALWTSALPLGLQVGATPLIVGWAGWQMARQRHPSVSAVLWRSDGGVTLTLRGDAVQPAHTVEASVDHARVLGPLIVLVLGWTPRQHAVLWLLPGNLDADTRRRLRVRINSGKAVLSV